MTVGPGLEDLAKASNLRSRAISAENPTGARGAGGREASALGPGRKGRPCLVSLKPGSTHTLAEIQGPGCIRHVWMTFPLEPEFLRGLVLRAYWDDRSEPSIECPVGDLFGVAHGRNVPYASLLTAMVEGRGLNTWMPMPFAKSARITVEVDTAKEMSCLFYQVDYTLGDEVDENTGRLCCSFRRENPTRVKEDFAILPQVGGCGRFLGCVVGVRTLFENWWGEGELKVYLDGDTDLPTICGTGTEDYILSAWGVGQHANIYQGCPLHRQDLVSFYRWHVLDPIYFQESIRVTIQQIGWGKPGLFERCDDWSAAAFWYQTNPGKLPDTLPSREQRLAALLEPREGEPGYKKPG